MTELVNIEEISKTCSIVDPLDYVKDGLIHCHKCNTPKEVVLELIDKTKKVFCICECEKQLRDMKSEGFIAQQENEHIKHLQTQGIQDKAFKKWTFEKDDGANPNMDIAHIYADNFIDDFYASGMGMVLWGDVGRGKTFMAACIANALIKKNIPVMMTSFNKIIGEIFSVTNKTEYFKEFNRYKLLIIDDLGADRQNEYAMEQVYNVVDERYKNNLPMIVTTNLTINELKNPKKVEYSRIYDRILEKCTPVGFQGKNYRHEIRNEQIEWAKAKYKNEKRVS
jgi:DNA replication protein DnaC